MKCPKCQFENPAGAQSCGRCAAPLNPPLEREPGFKEIDIVSPNPAPNLPTETLLLPIKELASGSTFAGRYQVIEELGKGGMGRVYKVFDTEVEEKVALKLLKPEIASDEETIKRFRNELKLARAISHKNVCRMFDLGKSEGSYYITMEYVPGEDLKSFIHRSGQLAVGKAIAVAAQIGEGLAEAHRLGVVHRDLKPQNIMIDREGNAKIMDFGIARTLSGQGITTAGVIIGTPEYMSPEQVEGKSIDQRSDIYSLGVILYEMLTGRVPFEAETPLGVLVKHKTEAPPDPREMNAQIPAVLSRLVLECLEKQKEKRPAKVEDILTELAGLREQYPGGERIVPLRKPTAAREITVKFKPRKMAAPALAILALAAAAILAWRFFLRPKAAPVPVSAGKPSLAVLYFENVSADPGLEGWRTGLTELLITDLEQSRFVRILSGDRVYGILKKLNLLEEKRYSTADLVKVADEGKVNHVASGSLMKAGENIIITLRLQKPHTGEVIRSERIECHGEVEIAPKIDELTKLIKSDLKLTPEQLANDIDHDLGKITSSSPEALKQFSEGWRNFRRGDYRQSIPFFEKAIAADPQFATAYDNLAQAYGNMGYRSEYKKYLQKAFESSDRSSDMERLRIRGNFYLASEKTYSQAIEAFQELLALYPDFWAAHSQLGLLYGESEEWEKAIAQYDIIVQQKVDEPIPYVNLAIYSNAMGRYDKTKEALRYYLREFSDNALIHRFLGFTAVYEGEYEEALAEAEKLRALAPGLYSYNVLRGLIFLIRGDMSEAEKNFQALLESPEKIAHLIGRHRLSHLYLLQGKFSQSQDECRLGIEEAKSIGEMTWCSTLSLGLAYRSMRSGNPEKALEACAEAFAAGSRSHLDLTLQRASLFYKGMALLERGQAEEAEKTAAELELLLKEGINRRQARYLDLLRGMIELKKAAYPNAIAHIERAVSLLPCQYGAFPIDDNQALFYQLLAEAHLRSGDVVRAQAQYEKISALITGRVACGDIYARSFYMLGKIWEQQGEKLKARENYQKFLDLWKDADPGLPEVAEAKKRLASLF